VLNVVDIIIVGGGKVGIRLIELLKKQENYDITLIDNHQEVIDVVKEEFDDVTIINGDATNRKVLEKAGIKTADIIVAATSIDEVNLLIGMVAQNYNLSKIIARTANPTHIKMFKKLGLNEVISPELTACSNIEKLIIKPNIADLSISGKGDCELIDITVKSKKVIGKSIGQISPAKDFIVIMCEKNNEEMIANNEIILEKDDTVTVLVKRKAIKKTRKFFTKNSLLPSL
jgi:trk system potassium uptake protein TrkA